MFNQNYGNDKVIAKYNFLLGIIGVILVCTGCVSSSFRPFEDEERVAAMEERCESLLRDPETGLIYTFLDKETMLPPTAECFADAVENPLFVIDGFDMPDKYMHEDCGICTGGYLCAQVLRYELTGKPLAFERAKKSFDALCHVYEVGKEVEEGFFPKLFGRRLSYETSSDQVLYVCFGLEAYLPYASAEEAAKIRVMIPQMLRFWMKRNYKFHYFRAMNDQWQWPVKRFPPLLLLAWKLSGDEEFHQEYLRRVETALYPEWNHLAVKKLLNNPTPEEKALGGWLLYGGAGRITMDVMNYDLLLRYDPENPAADQWRDNIRTMWNEVKDLVALEGYDYNLFIVDFKTGEIRRFPGWPIDKAGRDGARSSNSTHIIRAAMQALRHCPDLEDEIIPIVNKVLDKFSFEDLTYADEPERFKPSDRYKTRLLSGDCVINYIWADALLEQWKRQAADNKAHVKD